MPKGLPRNRPSATPNATFVEKTTEPSIPAKDTPALAKAKMGITTNDTKGCMACSSRCEGGMASRVSFRICQRRDAVGFHAREGTQMPRGPLQVNRFGQTCIGRNDKGCQHGGYRGMNARHQESNPHAADAQQAPPMPSRP